MDEKAIKQELGEEAKTTVERVPERKEENFIKLALKRAKEWNDAVSDAITRAKEEKRFTVLGEHWPDDIKKIREAATPKLPCLVLNHAIVHRDGVAGEILQNMPRGKYRGFDDDNDPEMAEIGTSILRRVEANSNIEDIDAEAIKQALTTGYPAWQHVNHDYADTESFRQEIFIRHIPAQYSVALDPNTTAYDLPGRGGPKWGMIQEDMPKAEFERLYPSAALASLEALDDDEVEWWTGDTVRVASYYVAEPKTVTLLLFKGDIVVEKNSAEHELIMAAAEASSVDLKPLRTRRATRYDIMHYKITGKEILPNDEGKREGQKIAGEYIPIIPFEGKYDYLDDGKKFYRGVFSNAMDANRMQDLWASKAAEIVATGQQFIGTAKQVDKFQNVWNNPIGHKFLPFEADPGAPNAVPVPVQSAAEFAHTVQMVQYTGQQIMDLVNRHESSIGAQGNEKSGRAILARQQQGNNSNYEFPLNFARAIRYRTKIVESMIPEVYDYEMALRIVGEDGREKKRVTINQPGPVQLDGKGEAIQTYLKDTTKARFDTVVDIGPSFKTQRMEAAEMIKSLTQGNPTVAEITSDLIFQWQDFPGADEASKRFRFMLEQKYPGMAQAGESDSSDAAIEQKIKAVVQQVEQKAMQAMEAGNAKINELMQQLQAMQAALAEKDQKIAAATAAMDSEAKKYELEARKLDIEDRKVALEERRVGGDDGKWDAAMRQMMETIQSVDRGLALMIKGNGGAA